MLPKLSRRVFLGGATLNLWNVTRLAAAPPTVLPGQVRKATPTAIVQPTAVARGTATMTKASDAYVRRTIAELHTFTNWLTENKAKGAISEFGIPNNRDGMEQSQWNALLKAFYLECEARGLHTEQWSSGKGWNTGVPYNLGIFVNGGPNGTAISIALPGSEITAAHMSATSGVGIGGNEWPAGAWGFDRSVDWNGFVCDSGDFAYLASRGVRDVRYDVAWERLQPSLGGTLDPNRLSDLNTVLQAAHANRVTVNLDIANNARYTLAAADPNAGIPMTRTGTVNASHLSDLWTRLSAWVRADGNRNAATRSFFMMNEPHDLTAEMGTFTSAITRYGFDAGVQGWVMEPDTPLALDTTLHHDGAGSASATFTGTRMRVVEGYEPLRNLSGNGTTLSTWVYVPASAEGSWNATHFVYNASYSQTIGANCPLTKGAWTQVKTTFTTSVLQNVKALGVQFQTSVSGRTTVHIDTVQQGSAAGGLTAAQVWESIAQSVVTAIRSGKDNRLLYIPGYEWSHTHAWPTIHPGGFIADSANNFRYEAHHYWDYSDGRPGRYSAPYATELATAVTVGY